MIHLVEIKRRYVVHSVCDRPVHRRICIDTRLVT